MLSVSEPYKGDGILTSCVIIANPVAGRGLAVQRARALEDMLRRRAFDVRLVLTERRGAATYLASQLAGTVGRLIVVGGDGTLNEVINGVANTSQYSPEHRELVFLPAGTGNAARRAFRMSSNPRTVADALSDARWIDVDVGVLHQGTAERRFLLWLGAGLDAVLIKSINEERTGPVGPEGLLRSFPRVARAVRDYQPGRIKVDAGNGVAGICEGVIVANVAAIPFAGGLGGGIGPEDGELDVIQIPPLPLLGKLVLAAHLVAGQLVRKKGIRHTRSKEVTLDASSPVPVQVDGEPAGYLPARVSVIKGAIRLLRTGGTLTAA